MVSKIKDANIERVRNYTYQEIVDEYQECSDKGSARFLKMEGKKRSGFKEIDFIRNRKTPIEEINYEQIEFDDIEDDGNYTLPDFTPKHLKDEV